MTGPSPWRQPCHPDAAFCASLSPLEGPYWTLMDKCTQMGSVVPTITRDPKPCESCGAGKAHPSRAGGPRRAGRREALESQTLPQHLSQSSRTGWAAQPRVCRAAGSESPAAASPAPGTRGVML